MWQDITFRTGHPGPHVSLWWIAGDWQPCLLAQCHVCQHWHKLIISSRSLLQPGFPFSEAMINHFQKIQQELKTLRWAFNTNLLWYFAPERPCTLRYSFLLQVFCFHETPLSFTEISRSQVGGRSMTRHGTEVFLWPRRPWHADRCVFPSTIGWELPSIGPYKDWLTIWILEVYPQNSCWNTLRQLYSCLSQWQLLGTMALPWVAPSPTTSYYINGTKLYVVSVEEREHLRTAPFGAYSLFNELATKLQLRDKTASQQRDYSLYRVSAPFTVGIHVLLHIGQHRLDPCNYGRLLCQRHCRSHVSSPFWPLEDMVQDIPFTNEEDDDTWTRALFSPIVTRPSTL